jgi:uroporphyrin-III C-methyltransferase
MRACVTLASCSYRVSHPRPRRGVGSRRTSGRHESRNPTRSVASALHKSESEFDDGRTPPGTVYLVGAGPGGLDYLTVKALRILRQCDAVVYDDLGSNCGDILNQVKPSCELVFVGKRGGDLGSWRQGDVNEVLVKLSIAGKTTCRLKGGCPSVFSRVREEMAALNEHNVPYELVPGISSSSAAPLSANVPLTDKNFGKHFVVTSAHDVSSLNFAAYTHIDTAVFLMAGKALPVIVTRLIREAKKETNTPCVVVKNGCTDRETVFYGTLATIAETTAGQKLSPCVFVVGEVCAEAVGGYLSKGEAGG